MSEPERWKDGGGGAELRDLVKSVRRTAEMPPDADQRLATLVAGLPLPAAAATTVAVSVKVGIGLALGVATAATVFWVGTLNKPVPRDRVVSSAPVQPIRPSAAPEVTLSPPSPAEKEQSAAPAPVVIARQVVSPPSNSLDTTQDLAAEAALLRDAHQALTKAPSEALRLTQRHLVEFQQGRLAAERELVAIDALLRLGRKKEAEARARAIIRQDPNGFYAQRVERLLAR